jgi:hypothetical protein
MTYLTRAPLTHVTGCDWCANGVCVTRVYCETIKLSYLPLCLETRECYHPLSQTHSQLYPHLCGIFLDFACAGALAHIYHTQSTHHTRTHPSLPSSLTLFVSCCVIQKPLAWAKGVTGQRVGGMEGTLHPPPILHSHIISHPFACFILLL